LIIGGALCVGSAGAMRTALPDLWKYDSRRFHRDDTHSSS